MVILLFDNEFFFYKINILSNLTYISIDNYILLANIIYLPYVGLALKII